MFNRGLYPVLFNKRNASISSTVLSAGSSSSTIVIPASAAVGDLAILFDHGNQTGGTSDVIPTGWTGLVTDAGSPDRIRCSYKKLVGGDPGATITGLNATSVNKLMLVFRPTFSITTITPSTWLAQVTTGNPASQAVSASGQATPLVVCGGAGVFDATAVFSTASPAFDAEIASSNADIIVGYKIYNSAPVNHTIDMDDLGRNGLASGYLKVVA